MRKKKKSLSFVFIQNYIFVFILLLISYFLTAVLINQIDQSKEFITANSSDTLMQEDYQNIDCTKLIDLGGSMCVVSDNYKILRSEGSPIFNNMNLTCSTFTDFLTSSYESMNYVTVSYNENEHFWLVVSCPRQVKLVLNLQFDSSSGSQSIILFLLMSSLCILIFLLGIFVFSRISSAVLKNPLRQLKGTADNIKAGNYKAPEPNSHIKEIYSLEEAFYLMSVKIADEINNTKQSEENRKKLMLDISHDLKNPLMSISGYSELLRKSDLIEDKEKYINIIFENSMRADKLVKDLFMLAKMENMQDIGKLEKIDIAELLKKTLIERLDELIMKGLETDFNIPDSEVYISGDCNYLNRVFSNIIDNTLRYCSNGTVFKVRLSSESFNAEMVFSNGSTLLCDDCRKLKDAFSRADGSEKLSPEGSGLGLTIVEKIVQMHNGQVICDYHKGFFEIKILLPIING